MDPVLLAAAVGEEVYGEEAEKTNRPDDRLTFEDSVYLVADLLLDLLGELHGLVLGLGLGQK